MPVAKRNSTMRHLVMDGVTDWMCVHAPQDISVEGMSEDHVQGSGQPCAISEDACARQVSAQHQRMHQIELRDEDETGEQSDKHGKDQPLDRRSPVEEGPEEVGVKDRPDDAYSAVNDRADQ